MKILRKNTQLNRETKFELKYFVITEGSLGPQEKSRLHPLDTQYLMEAGFTPIFKWHSFDVTFTVWWL